MTKGEGPFKGHPYRTPGEFINEVKDEETESRERLKAIENMRSIIEAEKDKIGIQIPEHDGCTGLMKNEVEKSFSQAVSSGWDPKDIIFFSDIGGMLRCDTFPENNTLWPNDYYWKYYNSVGYESKLLPFHISEALIHKPNKPSHFGNTKISPLELSVFRAMTAYVGQEQAYFNRCRQNLNEAIDYNERSSERIAKSGNSRKQKGEIQRLNRMNEYYKRLLQNITQRYRLGKL